MHHSTESAGPHYSVVGAGAIGATLAYHLVRAGKSVNLIDTDRNHVEAIRAQGLRITPSTPDRPAVKIDAHIPEDFTGTLDRVILAVKAQHSATAAEWIASRLDPQGWVVSMQNGLNEETIASFVGLERTIGAFVNLNADVIGPGEIHDGGIGALVVGELDGTDSERIRELVADLSSWGPAVTSDNVQGYLWAKLAYGAMLTATALSNAPMAGSVARNANIMTTIAREVCAVANAVGIRLENFDAFNAKAYRPGADRDEAIAATNELAAWLSTLSKKNSGIWRDMVIKKRKTEIPTQYAAVLQAAKNHGARVPVLEKVLAMLEEIEWGSREISDANLQDLSNEASYKGV